MTEICVGFEDSEGGAGIFDIHFVHGSFTVPKLHMLVSDLQTKLFEEYRFTKTFSHFKQVLQFLRDEYRLEVSFNINLIDDEGEINDEMEEQFNEWFKDDQEELAFSYVEFVGDRRYYHSVCMSSEGSGEKLIELFKLCKVISE